MPRAEERFDIVVSFLGPPVAKGALSTFLLFFVSAKDAQDINVA
jgi:hypothetical protein